MRLPTPLETALSIVKEIATIPLVYKKVLNDLSKIPLFNRSQTPSEPAETLSAIATDDQITLGFKQLLQNILTEPQQGSFHALFSQYLQQIPPNISADDWFSVIYQMTYSCLCNLLVAHLSKIYFGYSLDMDGCSADYPAELRQYIHSTLQYNPVQAILLDSASARNNSLLDDIGNAVSNFSAGREPENMHVTSYVLNQYYAKELQELNPNLPIFLYYTKNLELVYKDRLGFAKLYYSLFNNKIFNLYYNVHKHAVFLNENNYSGQLHEFFFDDRKENVQAVYDFYKNHPYYLPKNVVLHVIWFPENVNSQKSADSTTFRDLGMVRGIGNINPKYEDTMARLCLDKPLTEKEYSSDIKATNDTLEKEINKNNYHFYDEALKKALEAVENNQSPTPADPKLYKQLIQNSMQWIKDRTFKQITSKGSREFKMTAEIGSRLLQELAQYDMTYNTFLQHSDAYSDILPYESLDTLAQDNQPKDTPSSFLFQSNNNLQKNSPSAQHKKKTLQEAQGPIRAKKSPKSFSPV